MKNHNEKVSIKRLTIAAVIMLLSIFTLLKTGNAVTSFYNFIDYLLGSSTPVVLGIVIYICIQYMIDVNYIFYKSKTFWALVCVWLGILIVVTNTYGFKSSFSVYLSGLASTYQFNGGIIGYIIIYPLYLLIGNLGLNILAFVLIGYGSYLLYTLFYEVEKPLSAIAKEKLTPNQITKEQREKLRKEKEFKKKEKLAQKELKNAKPIEKVSIKKEDPYNHFLNLKIKKENDIKVREVSNVKKTRVTETKEPENVKKVKRNDEVKAQIKEVTNEGANVNVMKFEKGIEQKVKQSGSYIIPPMSLLSASLKDNEALKRLEKSASENAKILEMTLESFKLSVKIINVSIGPNITKYELQPENGVKVSRFSSLSNDLAMALAATSIRIEAPIPGKAAVGIEIPNKEILSVSLKEVLMSKNNNMDEKLQVALGKDISGESIFMEINKSPHMLVAGATGSGKSVSINSFIISILLKATPKQVKMIMIDPKKVELAPYNGIPHLLTPVVTEPKRAAVILKKMVLEMEVRYELFAKTNTRNIEGYNSKLKRNNPDNLGTLPYIVIIIDELADLMMVASNEVETSIARLAQMARAAGIHLVIATQRPSTDVITGLIKSNIPTRLSFSVSSSIDSRTILDQSGAEKLLGKGDMLYSANGSNMLNRIQGTYVSDDDITQIVEFITNQEYEKDKLEEEQAEFEKNISKVTETEEQDELFEEAVNIVLEANSASTSLLQRRLRIGFNRASNIMEQMEEAGIVSANEGTKPRRILITSYGDENE